jgi:hypothetical protein
LLHYYRDGIELLSIFLTAAFTGVLAWSTIRLWTATKDLVASGDSQHIISNRAFVFVSSLQYNELADGGLSVMIAFKNGGGTPTKEMTSNVNAEVKPGPLPSNHTYPGRAGEDVSASIGPQADVAVNQLIFTADQFQEVLHSGHRLFIWGLVKYRDVFDGTPHRETRFSYELIAKADGDGVHFMRFAQYGTYNETT